MTAATEDRMGPDARLRALLADGALHVMPCCFDALSARLIERAGFPLTFMSGFAVSGARLGAPDTGLISYGEMLDQGRNICDAVSIPGDWRRGHRLWEPRQREADGAGLRARRIRLRDDRGSGRAQALRSHSRQGGRLAREPRSCACPRRGRRPRGRARRHPRDGPHRRALRPRLRRGAVALSGVSRPRRRHHLLRGAVQSEQEMERLCAARCPVPRWRTWSSRGIRPCSRRRGSSALGYQIAAYPLTLFSAAIRRDERGPRRRCATAGRRSACSALPSCAPIVGFPEYDAEQARYREG